MRVLVVVALLLAGCASSSDPGGPDATRPIHSGTTAAASPEPEPGPEAVGFPCDDLPKPETWYGHASGDLWCVGEGGWGASSGSVVTPMTTLHQAYMGWNGSAGHPAETPIEAHVHIVCLSVACLADVVVTLAANGTEVARLAAQEVVVDALILGGVWVDVPGSLDAKIPAGAHLSMDVEVGGVGPLMLLSYSGDIAPWFEIG